MKYFIDANSFGAPFFSDGLSKFVEGKDAEDAMNNFIKDYKHPAGLYSANLYEDANAFHEGHEPLLKYRSNKQLRIEELTADKKSGYSILTGTDFVEIDNIRYTVDNPKEGRIIKSAS